MGHGFETSGQRDGDAHRLIGSIDAQYAFKEEGSGGFVGQIGADRDLRSTNVRGGANYAGELGSGRIELRHQLEGARRTRYDVSLQSGFALNHSGALFGARQTNESAVFVSLKGQNTGTTFRVLVDDTERGEVRSGERLALFLPAYRTYRVRLLPKESAPVELDTQAREITLYPGNVLSLSWMVERYATFFAQAVSSDGRPVADALVQTTRNVAQTDDDGYFQVDVKPGDRLRFSRSGMTICTLVAPSSSGHADLISAGKVICR
jgi:hypothetical protein